MSRMTMLSLLTIGALAAGPTRGWGAQDPKKPAPGPPPAPGPDVTSPIPAMGGVTPPAPLSRTDLTRRLKTIDGSLPDVLPAGATVTLTPDRPHSTRTWLMFENVELLHTRPGQGVAVFPACSRLQPGGIVPRMVGGVVWLQIDAVVNVRYVLDAFVTVGEACTQPGAPPPPPPTFRVAVHGPAGLISEHSSTTDNGHVVVAFRAAANARHSVTISLSNHAWSFYRVDMTRVP
jgi:hypothetical protein